MSNRDANPFTAPRLHLAVPAGTACGTRSLRTTRDSAHVSCLKCLNMVQKPRRGRPPRAGKAALERIELRVTRLERAAWDHAAARAGLSLSEWIRGRCAMGPPERHEHEP